MNVEFTEEEWKMWHVIDENGRAIMPTCPCCETTAFIPLDNSLLCPDCYTAAISGISVEQVRAVRAAERDAIQRENVRIIAERANHAK